MRRSKARHLQMKTWPTAPHTAKPRTSFHTAGWRAIKSSAARSSPAPPTTSMPSQSPRPVATSQGLSSRYRPVTSVLIMLLAHIICGPV
jgi:hypothetical protein